MHRHKSKRDRWVDKVIREIQSLTEQKSVNGSEFSVSELDAIDRQLEVAMASLRGYRNSLLPIHRLPPELLTEIFHLTMSSPESFCPWFEYDHAPKPPKVQNWSLLHVCRHWRGIMATSPKLWSTVDSLCRPESFLKRAGGAPHRIFISDGNDIAPTLLEALTAEPQRLAEYHIWGGGGQAIWKLLNAGSAPLLEALTLVLNAGITNPVLPPIFEGNMPRLKKLALSYYTSWPSGYFKGLTHLYLCTQAQNARPTISEFLDFLEESPLLEVLSLDIAGPTRDNNSEIPPTPASRFVDLKHLKELNIAGWPTITIIARFLSHLCLPPTTNMYIWGMCLTNIDEDLGLLLPTDPSRLQNLQSIRRLVISRHPAIHQKTPPFVVIENATLYVFGPLSPRHIIPIALRYPLDKVRRFTIWDSFHAPSDGIPTQVWNDFFQQMPSLRSLHIIRSPSTTGLARSVVSALLPPHEKNGDKEKDSEKTAMTKSDDTRPHPDTVLCPQLRTLTIEGDPKLPTLLLGALAQDRSNGNISLKKIEITTSKYAGGTPPPNDLSPLSSDTDSEDKNGVFTTEDVYFLKKHVRDVIFTQKTQQGEMVLIPPELGGRLFKWIRTLYASVMTPS